MSRFHSVSMGASEARLENLIRERLKPKADKKKIDERIWDLFGEDWAVMFTDLSGFSRGVSKFGIVHFLQTIIESERLLVPVIESHDGIILKVEGDSMLVIFRNPMKAIAGAIEMQRATHRYNKHVPAEEKILLCVGIGYGRMLRIGDSDVFGVEVNSASKLGEDTAKSGEILVTEAVRKSAEKRAGLSFSPIKDVPAGTGKAFLVKYTLPK